MRRLFELATACAALLSAASPAAADVFCSYKVDHLWVTSEGWINVSFTSDLGNKNWWLCQLGTNTSVNDGYGNRTVNPDTCSAVYSQLLSARLSDRSVMFQFHGPSDCNASSLPGDGVMALHYANIGILLTRYLTVSSEVPAHFLDTSPRQRGASAAPRSTYP